MRQDVANVATVYDQLLQHFCVKWGENNYLCKPFWIKVKLGQAEIINKPDL